MYIYTQEKALFWETFAVTEAFKIFVPKLPVLGYVIVVATNLAKISRAYANTFTCTWCSPFLLMING